MPIFQTSSQDSCTISAPKRRTPANLVWGAVSGMMTVHGMPRRRACHARACAMFPALHVYTPRFRSAGERREIALPAPRTLNEPEQGRADDESGESFPRGFDVSD